MTFIALAFMPFFIAYGAAGAAAAFIAFFMMDWDVVS